MGDAYIGESGPEIVIAIDMPDPMWAARQVVNAVKAHERRIAPRRATARKARQRRQWAKVWGGRRDG